VRQIPATGSVPPLVRGHIDAIKQNIETITGVRGKPIPQLATGASSDDITAKVNSILSLLQNTGQSAAKSILPPDPTDAYFQPKVWVSGPDLVLGIGQSAKITATAATSMPLHIACGDGQIYEIDIAGSYTAAAAAANPILQPNNAVPSTNSFLCIGEYTTGTSVIGIATTIAEGGFRLNSIGSSVQAGNYTVSTSTLNKKMIGVGNGNTTASSGSHSMTVSWTDTTTPYTSLGTIIMPNAWTGTIVVRRVA